MEKLTKIGNVLGRSEMKKIMAGSGTNCLICWGPSGPDEYCTEFGGGDPTLECRKRGPYSNGSWGECTC